MYGNLGSLLTESIPEFVHVIAGFSRASFNIFLSGSFKSAVAVFAQIQKKQENLHAGQNANS